MIIVVLYILFKYLIDILASMKSIVVRECAVFLLSLLLSYTRESAPYKDVVNGML